ncbi:PspC domain-containing protein [bacterium]|nr:PspC domain-containing protein [bacterium]MBU1937196.1 PspC domain-containing protein [bacterium]
MRRLHRSLRNKKIAGICGGLGDYFNIDPTIFRLLWIFLLLFYGTGILIYLILWIVIPQEPVIITPPNSTT